MSKTIRTVAELDIALPVPCSSLLELSVELDDGQSMVALINGGLGWLMHLRHYEDAGFSSRNPGYSGDPKGVISYQLSNGQIDEYPAAWAYPVEQLKQALTFFLESRQRPSWIQWHADGKES